jgi:hypothetical protein
VDAQHKAGHDKCANLSMRPALSLPTPPRAAKGTIKGSLMIGSTIVIQPLIALIAGILILIAPRILNYVVAAYLILIGIAGLLPALQH